MGYLFVSIVCSVMVSVLLKYAKPKGINLAVAIGVNYIVCVCLSSLLLKPTLDSNLIMMGLPLFVALGVLLPSVFLIMGKSAQVVGIVKSDTAQRISLIIPLIASFVLFGEAMNVQKILSLMLIFVAMACLVLQKQPKQSTLAVAPQGSLLLLGVFVGYGVIGVLLKQLAKMGSASTSNLFVSFLLAFIFMITYIILKKMKPTSISIKGGLILGILNFTNIYTYINAHKVMSDRPSLVFAVMDMGVIIGGVLAGYVIFKEKINLLSATGIGLALLAIALLYIV